MKKLFLLLGIIPMLIVVFLVQPKAMYIDQQVDYMFFIDSLDVPVKYIHQNLEYSAYGDLQIIDNTSATSTTSLNELHTIATDLSSNQGGVNVSFMLIIPNVKGLMIIGGNVFNVSVINFYYNTSNNQLQYNGVNVNGQVLFTGTAITNNDIQDWIYLEPFNFVQQQLVDNAYNKGYNEGLDDGYDMAYDIGYDIGYDLGYTNGLNTDTTDAYDQGYTKGYNDRFASGLEKWIVPAIIIVLVGGGFLSIMALKRKD